MQTISAIHESYASATPTQKQAADDRRARMLRFAAAAERMVAIKEVPPPIPHSEVEPCTRPREVEPVPLPPIPNALMAAAVDFLDGRFNHARIETIQRAVLKHFTDITIIDLKSDRRMKYIVRPRQIAMFLCKTMTRRSLPEIGRRFGDKDHSTVLHAVRKIESMIASDPKFAALVDGIKQMVQGDEQLAVQF